MIDTCKQFNTKEADALQTTEFSKNPKIFWDIRIAFLFEIFCKAEVFFNFVKPKFQKTSSFPKFQNSKKIINFPKYFWNFGILENSRFFWNLIPKHQKKNGISKQIPKKHMDCKGFLPKFQNNLGFFLEFSKIPKKPRVFQNSKTIWASWYFFLNFGNFGKLEVFLEFDPKHQKTQGFFGIS